MNVKHTSPLTMTADTPMTVAANAPTLLLNSGRYLNYTEPEACWFQIEDIAHGLSNTCRFGGQCSRFYSVAEHCWLMSYIVPHEHRRAALMHDAAEAFIGDIPTPLKRLLPDFKGIEERLEAEIFKSFYLPYPFHPQIKLADLRMLAAEQWQVMHNTDDWELLEGVEPAPVGIQFLSPQKARDSFLGRYRELTTDVTGGPDA